MGKPGQETHQAWRWYLENKDLFDKEIFAPPALSCSIRDLRVVDAVEMLISRQSTAFVCQSPADYDTFTKEVIGIPGHPGLGLANITVKDFSRSRMPTLQDQPRPFTKEKVAAQFPSQVASTPSLLTRLV